MIGNQSCKRASALASDACERQLGLAERFRMHLHILICRSCRNCKQEIQLLHGVLERIREKDETVEVDLPQKDRELIRDALRDITTKYP